MPARARNGVTSETHNNNNKRVQSPFFQLSLKKIKLRTVIRGQIDFYFDERYQIKNYLENF